MLKECIKVFENELKSKGERILLDNYMPAEGTYIIVTKDNDKWDIKEENIIEVKYEKNKQKIINLETELNKIRALDYNSKLIDMNKPIDPKKIIHSNNYLSFFIKKDKFPTKVGEEKKLSNEAIEEYYSILLNPYLKYKSGKPKEIYESVEKSIGSVDVDELSEIKQWILENIFKLGKEYTGKNYLKIFFDYPIEKYIKENKRYTIPNIYNKNDYNIKKDDIVYGLPNDNIGLNSKKPYLENKTRKISVPNLVNTEDAIIQRKFFDYLMNFATEGKVNIYIGEKIEASDKLPSKEFSGNFIRVRKGKELEIVNFDKIARFKKKLEKDINYKNLLDINLKFKEDEYKFDEYSKKDDIENILSEVFFSKQLINNYFREAKDISIRDSTIKKNLLLSRNAIFNWIYKENSNGINKLLDRVSLSLIKNSIKNNYINTASKQFNLRWALKHYFEGGKDMSNKIKEIKENLILKMNKKQDSYIESDMEYCFAIGQLVSYFISQSKAAKKPQFLINNILNSRRDDVIKDNIRKIYKRYNYKKEMNTLRVRNLYNMILAYDLNGRLDEDMVLLGFLSDNLIYKADKKEAIGGEK